MGYRDFNHEFFEFLIRKGIILSKDTASKVKVSAYRDFIKEVAVYRVLPDMHCFFERTLPKYLKA